MSIIDRTTAFYRGRAIFTLNGVTLYPGPQPALIKTTTDYVTVPVAGQGVIDKKIKQITTEITLVPHGAISAPILALLYPHTNPIPGASAMPSTDQALVVWPANSHEKLTFPSAFVSKMPELYLSAVKMAFGQMTITCIGRNAEAWTVADHFVKVEDATFADVSGAGIALVVPYTASLGSLTAPWNNILTKSGWTFSPNIALDAREEDSIGIFDYLYKEEHTCSVKCNPIGLKVADLHGLKLLEGSGAARGASATGLKQVLTITGGSGNPILVVNNCVLDTAQHQYGDDDRVGELEFTTVRSLTAGALNALFSIGLNA